MEKEIDNYKKRVKGLLGGHRFPKSLENARTRSLSGIVYEFAGLGPAQDFPTFYISSDVSQILPVIENLFMETCFPWKRGTGEALRKVDLRSIYMPLLRINPKKLEKCLEDTLQGGQHPFRKDSNSTRIWLRDTGLLINPVTFVLSADLCTDTKISTIHGDLNGYNILIDRRQETWLIDFASTCKGPFLHDYATFETFLRVSLVKCSDPNLLYSWDRLLLHAPDLCTAPLAPDLAYIPEIEKAHQAILVVRKLALQEHMGDTERAYLIGLLFNALKLVTVMDINSSQRDHALISAALIAERLQTSTQGG